jgi:thiosulfate/3-mercaptopyruvate sulfurtransferase
MPRFVIIGAGAIGVTAAAELKATGNDVALIARGAQLEAARDGGINYVTIKGERRLDVPVHGSADDVDLTHEDVLLLTTKTQDALTALAPWSFKPVTLADGTVSTAGQSLPLLTTENGLETERVALRDFRHVYAGVLGIPVSYTKPGEVVNFGVPVNGVWALGHYPDAPASDRLKEIAVILRHANFDVTVTDTISVFKNGKIAGAVNFVLDALFKPSPLRDRAAARIRRETAEILQAAGLPPVNRFGAGPMFHHASIPGHDRGGFSTWQSLSRGNSVETDYLNGEIVLQARLLGREAPFNEAVTVRMHRFLQEGGEPGSLGDDEILETFPALAQEDPQDDDGGVFPRRNGGGPGAQVRSMSDEGLLLEADELHALLSGADAPAILDVRWALGDANGKEHHAEGHIPGAVYVDLDTELAAPPSAQDGRHPLPELSELQDAARRWGVRDGQMVVVYDDNGGLSAARAWWLLRWAGVKKVRILNGALSAWKAAGLPLQNGEVRPAPGDVTLTPDHLPVLSADEAAAFPENGTLLDARAGERYRGEQEPIDPRAGHIPGAVNVPTTGNLGEDGRFLTASELRQRFRELGVNAAAPIGAYCGSGVTAAHLIAALNVAGIEASLFPGSWSAWSSDPERPVAVGAAS